VGSRFFETLAQPLVRYGVGALALLLFSVLLFVFVPPILALAGPPPDLWVAGYGPERLAGYLGALGERGRALYGAFLRFDLGFALVYGLALSGWVHHLYRSPAYAGVPLAAALADVAENLLLLAELDRVRPALAMLAGYLTFFKWCLLALALVFLGYALVLQRR